MQKHSVFSDLEYSGLHVIQLGEWHEYESIMWVMGQEMCYKNELLYSLVAVDGRAW